MGSLVVKIDNNTASKLKNRHHYSDVDMLNISNNDQVSVQYDVDAVKLAIRNILMWRVGESILFPEFGHNIHKSMYEQMDQFNKEKICQEIQRTLEENEPRIKVYSVGVKSDSEDGENALRVRVVYTVIGDKSDDTKFTEQTTILGI